MPAARTLDDLAATLARVLPPGLGSLRRELEANFRAVLQAHLEKLDLVSRERFEAQAELLAHANQRLARLEARIAALEDAAATPPAS